MRVATAPAQPTPGNPFTLTKTVSSKDPPLSIPAQASNVPPPPANATPWQKAEYYERLGQWNEAIRTYEQLGRDLQVTRPEWADFARKRASYLSTGGRAPINWSARSPAATSTFYPASQQQPAPVVRLAPPSTRMLRKPCRKDWHAAALAGWCALDTIAPAMPNIAWKRKTRIRRMPRRVKVWISNSMWTREMSSCLERGNITGI